MYTGKLPRLLETYHWPLFTFGTAIVLLIVSSIVIPKSLSGDSQTYLDSMKVLLGGVPPMDFLPNRLLTTSGGLITILALSPFLGILASWMTLNTLFFFAIALGSFYLFKNLLDDERAAYLGSFLIIAHYGPIVFAASYLMDAGGWAFFFWSLVFTTRFLKTRETKDILVAALVIAIGGVFKEYALVASLGIAIALLGTFASSPKKNTLLAFATAVIALTPVAI